MSAKNFVFRGFEFEVGGNHFRTEPGFICWHYIIEIDDKDQKLFDNLKKSYEGNLSSIVPSDKK